MLRAPRLSAAAGRGLDPHAGRIRLLALALLGVLAVVGCSAGGAAAEPSVPHRAAAATSVAGRGNDASLTRHPRANTPRPGGQAARPVRLAGRGGAPPRRGGPVSRRGGPVSRRGGKRSRAPGYPAYFAASVSGSGRGARQGLALFSSSTGKLVRWLLHSKAGPTPVAVSPGGKWLYYYNQAALARSRCRANAFSEPWLWRVPVRGGPPHWAGIRSTSIAISPDGRMVAWVSARGCRRTLRITVWNRETGAIRRILLASNRRGSRNPVFGAQLSWAPDDTHLAVALAPDSGSNTLAVIDARQARSVAGARSIGPCAGRYVGCLDPAFDVRGRLSFLRWLEKGETLNEWVMRWRDGTATRLWRLNGSQSAGLGSIAVDRSGDAVLLESYSQYPEIWRLAAGHAALMLRSARAFVVLSPVWLGR
jgi:hypothetical protein